MPPSVPASMSMSCEGVRSRASRMPPAGISKLLVACAPSSATQHLALEIEQIVDAFGETRVAGGLQSLAHCAQARAPGESRALAAPHGSLARVVRQICGSSSSSRWAVMISRTVGAAVARELGEARAHGVERTIERALLHIDAPPGFDDGDLDRLQIERRARRRSRGWRSRRAGFRAPAGTAQICDSARRAVRAPRASRLRIAVAIAATPGRGLRLESDDDHLVAAANSQRHQRHGAARRARCVRARAPRSRRAGSWRCARSVPRAAHECRARARPPATR